jgi:hypothetical protein
MTVKIESLQLNYTDTLTTVWYTSPSGIADDEKKKEGEKKKLEQALWRRMQR